MSEKSYVQPRWQKSLANEAAMWKFCREVAERYFKAVSFAIYLSVLMTVARKTGLNIFYWLAAAGAPLIWLYLFASISEALTFLGKGPSLWAQFGKLIAGLLSLALSAIALICAWTLSAYLAALAK